MRNPIYLIVFALYIFTLGSCKPDKTPTLNTTGTVNFNMVHSYGLSSPVKSNASDYTNKAGNTFNISKLKYYLSNIILVNDKGEEIKLQNYQLIDIEEEGSQKFGFDKIANGTYTKIKWLIGVDSVANSTGDHTGALDPSHGMDWGWNFGYRFLLLEGKYKARDTSTAIKGYAYHSGRNENLVSIEATCNFEVNGNTKEITINFDLEKVFNTPNTWDIYACDYNHSETASDMVKFKPLIENISKSMSITLIK